MGGNRAPSRTELIDYLVRQVEIRVLDPAEILLGESDALAELRVWTASKAAGWAGELLGGDDDAAMRTVMRLLMALYPDDGPFDPPAEWWRTPLGRVVVRRVGHPVAASVSYATAGAMLGVSRQFVHDLVVRGRLERHPDGGVSTASVRERAKA
ncbi:hypothetical protein [Allonocardiopsis opalescens]|uniref:Uncharacterized protein n=1 Tax=Allonocardiopsis opalescens TaxID=1144618 RepID=A0A2T0Q5N4_9ACTN|nr:hypothetical protein [Allonocardiopsis opalescens]PRX99080.1 hypothetical protein CLV72_104660 [Allonocardiopsis opalescens]